MGNRFVWRRWLRTGLLGGLATSFFLVSSTNALAQEQLPDTTNAGTVTAAAPASALTLPACLQIAIEQQPALIALRASLAAANTQYQGLEKLHFPAGLISPDLPIRRRQACLGIRIAEAGLDQGEWDTLYAVSRTYFGVLFARKQQKVAGDLVESLRFYQERVGELVKKGESREWTTSTVDKITIYLRLAETRQAEAIRGVERATAALREAMGVAPECPVQVADEDLPASPATVDRAQIISLALARRGELVQASTASEVVQLEVDAQSKLLTPVTKTFASVVDIHARPVPQGYSNGEYRPGATSLEMPPNFAGPREYRIERAREFSGRASAVVDKTRNLIALDAEDAYSKWEEWARKIPQLREASEAGVRLSKNTRDDFRAGQRVRIEDILTNEVLGAQAQAGYNEALYQVDVSLAGLQRVTAGGFDAGFGNPTTTHP
jgi:outer membrane protein TolC